MLLPDAWASVEPEGEVGPNAKEGSERRDALCASKVVLVMAEVIDIRRSDGGRRI